MLPRPTARGSILLLTPALCTALAGQCPLPHWGGLDLCPTSSDPPPGCTPGHAGMRVCTRTGTPASSSCQPPKHFCFPRSLHDAANLGQALFQAHTARTRTCSSRSGAVPGHWSTCIPCDSCCTSSFKPTAQPQHFQPGSTQGLLDRSSHWHEPISQVVTTLRLPAKSRKGCSGLLPAGPGLQRALRHIPLRMRTAAGPACAGGAGRRTLSDQAAQ